MSGGTPPFKLVDDLDARTAAESGLAPLPSPRGDNPARVPPSTRSRRRRSPNYAAKPDYRRRPAGRKGERGAGISGTSVTLPAASRRKTSYGCVFPPMRTRNLTVCGIAGIVHLDGSDVPRRVVRRMLAPLAHRGPDEHGVHVDGPVGLGHARLSIIDLAGGRQPMHNEDGSLWVTFNGEIFNYVELRAELAGRGPPLRHAVRHRGHPPRLRGVRRRLRRALQRPVRLRHLGPPAPAAVPLARPAGRPAAVLHVAGGKFLFASEVKALLADRDVPATDRPARARPDLHLLVAAGRRGRSSRASASLPPGHNLMRRTTGELRDRALLAAATTTSTTDGGRASAVGRRAARTADRRHAAAAARRRAGRRVPQRRARLVRDHGPGPAMHRRAACGPSRSPSTTPSSTRARTSGRWSTHLGTDHQAIRCTRQRHRPGVPRGDLARRAAVLRTAPAPLFLLSRAGARRRASRWC